jgi:molybdopterin converting factor small subunit
MNLNIKYFGVLVEFTGCQAEQLEFDKSTVAELIQTLTKKYPSLKDKDFQVAQNLAIASNEASITSSDIALLPPFSGG